MQDRGATPIATTVRRTAGLLAGLVLAFAVTAAPALAAPALVGQWRFDEADGQVALDDGPFALHGTLGSGASADGEDPLRIGGALGGGALRFDGAASVRIDDARRLDLPTLTVEAVARANGSPGPYRYLVSHGAVGCFSGAYGLYTARDGGLAFYVFDGERFFVSASASATQVWDGVWHRVTGTFDGVNVRVFVDGREVDGPLSTPDGTAIEYASMPMGTYFGTYVGDCRLPFSGDLDSVRIWTGAAAPQPAAPPSGTTPGTTPGTPLAAGSPAEVVRATPPKASCSVRVSRREIRTKRRVVLTVRAAETKGPLKRVRLSVRRANGRKVIASPRTNANGSARLVLNLRMGGRLRVGVAGRANCTPAFIKVSARG